MTANLLADSWAGVDSAELRLLLDARIGGPGQCEIRAGIPNTLFLPLARTACRIAIVFRDKKIVAIEPGPAFDPEEWARIGQEVETSILLGSPKCGREFSFSSFRVTGSWYGERSGVQILPPPNDAPQAPLEMAQHPFILEFPIQASVFWPITEHRRKREHRRLTLLLNVLLAGRTSLQPRRLSHFWAHKVLGGAGPESHWVRQGFFAKLGESVLDVVSPPGEACLETIDELQYYTEIGHDGRALPVPCELDQSICRYLQLSTRNRTKFDRATFWIDMASTEWTTSVSSSFAALVSAVEALTERGTIHRMFCDQCSEYSQHEVPGATERFRAFFEKYAPGSSLRKRRSEMYALRSGILHGSDLMQLDQDLAFGWDPPWFNEHQLLEELWSLTRLAVRNWLRNCEI